MHPAFAISLILFGLGTIILLAGWGVRAGKLSGEMARKTVHVGMGLLCLPFPWIFDSVLPVQILTVFAVVALLTLRIGKLKRSIGTALFSVERLSIGELLFPIAVGWLFTLGWDEPILYCISLLLLTLADTAGALIGSKYGKKLYTTTAATKSLLGSLSFFITAFLCIAIPLYFHTELSLPLILFLSLTVSIFTMAVEGAAGHGMDNLLIPIGAFLLLDYYVGLSSYDLLWRAGLLFILLLALWVTRRKHTFDGGALLTAMLFAFATLTLGGSLCLLATLLLFTRHLITQRNMPKDRIVTHSIKVIAAIALPSLFWLTLGRGGAIAEPVAQFGFIATLSLISAMLHAGTQHHLNQKSASLITGLILTAIILTPALCLNIPIPYFISPLLLAPPAAWLFFHWRNDAESLHWIKLCALATLTSSLVMAPLIF